MSKMVIVDTSFKKVQGLLKGDITIEELEQTLADMGFELDEVDGDEIKIEITAERTDLITPEGVARAINCYKKFTPTYQEIEVKKGDYVHKTDASVKPYRPFTRSFVVKGLKLTSNNIKELMNVQEKIHDTYGRKRKKVAIGVYDLGKLNFPITYCAKKPSEIKFVPLEMSQELGAMKILQKHPTGRNYAYLLEGLDKFPVQIDAKGQVLSMPPIINSNDLGKISTDSSDLFVEATGTSGEALDNIMNILATMFNDWNGKIYSVTIEDVGDNGKETKTVCPRLVHVEREISLSAVKKLIGIDITLEKAVELVQMMSYTVAKKYEDKNKLLVNIPSIRTDIWHEVDIADDLARAYGYNNIIPTMPNIFTIGEMLPMNKLVEDVCNFLASLGLTEVKTFALTNQQSQYQNMDFGEEEPDHISLASDTEDKNISMVRTWLVPEMLKVLVANRNKEYPQNLFEAGMVVIPDAKVDVRSRNVWKLASVLCDDKVDFTSIKQIIAAVVEYLGLKLETKETMEPFLIPGRAAEVLVNGQKIGFIGELHPQVLDNLELQVPVVAFEIDLQKVFGMM